MKVSPSRHILVLKRMAVVGIDDGPRERTEVLK